MAQHRHVRPPRRDRGRVPAKGSQVYVEGKLRTRKWQDKEGRDRYTTEIIANEMQMLGSRGAAAVAVAWAAASRAVKAVRRLPAAGGGGRAPAQGPEESPFDDDIPF